MPNTVTIDYTRLNTYEAGALFLTHLAYPEKTASDKQLGGIYTSLCAIAQKQICCDSNKDDNTPQLVVPAYALRDESQILKDLKAFPRRMRDRAVAGRMGAFFLKKAAMPEGSDIGLPQCISRVSLNQVAAAVLEDSKNSEPENVETRIWRPSLPVIHIAVAIQVMLQDIAKAGVTDEVNFMYLMLDPFFVTYIISQAESYIPLITKNDLPIAANKLTRFRVLH